MRHRRRPGGHTGDSHELRRRPVALREGERARHSGLAGGAARRRDGHIVRWIRGQRYRVSPGGVHADAHTGCAGDDPGSASGADDTRVQGSQAQAEHGARDEGQAVVAVSGQAQRCEAGEIVEQARGQAEQVVAAQIQRREAGEVVEHASRHAGEAAVVRDIQRRQPRQAAEVAGLQAGERGLVVDGQRAGDPRQIRGRDRAAGGFACHRGHDRISHFRRAITDRQPRCRLCQRRYGCIGGREEGAPTADGALVAYLLSRSRGGGGPQARTPRRTATPAQRQRREQFAS